MRAYKLTQKCTQTPTHVNKLYINASVPEYGVFMKCGTSKLK